MNAITPQEISAEMKLRYAERIGILCEDRVPTPEQQEIAAEEGMQWLERYFAENPQLTATPTMNRK